MRNGVGATSGWGNGIRMGVRAVEWWESKKEGRGGREAENYYARAPF